MINPAFKFIIKLQLKLVLGKKLPL